MNDEYVSSYTGIQIDNAITLQGKIVQVMQIIGLIAEYGTTSSEVTSPEWSNVITDSQYRILSGVRQDGSIFIADI
jgi:hypothetical protein